MANYYISSFFWSTLSKVLTAIVGFISVPLLLGYYGKADYGILSLATACNGYMHLLDLGMNTGAIRYFSIWKAEGKMDLVHRVARTNITFYTIIAVVNALILCLIAQFGKDWFTTTPEQFRQLQYCLYIIAGFSVFSWGTTTFNQLLIANKQMPFTAQMTCLMAFAKIGLVAFTLYLHLSLTVYFFCLTFVTASLIIPYAIKSKRDGMIDSYLPANHWRDFKVVLTFSLSIFALSLFQMSATQTRPLILGLFSEQGPSVNAEYRILEVIPSMIIMIGGVFSSIFLPQTSEMVAKGNQEAISKFSYKWTVLTTIIANVLCFPFIIGASEILGAYVGSEYTNLSIWLIIWIVCILCQIHSTPNNALILAYGKTKVMVYISGIACVVSMIINAVFAKSLGVGSAIVGYAIYIAINLTSYYFYYYKKVLHISICSILYSFLCPTLWGILSFCIVFLLCRNFILDIFVMERLNYIFVFLIKSGIWLLIYAFLLLAFKTIKLEGKQVLTKFDNDYIIRKES